ncbi:MAG: uracil-DNA glycosylase [Vicinamibacteria bacterium]|nr:uracil-DNA glycosylase [Vicinamibacteria bacterium]
MKDSLRRLERDVIACERCPRLRRWCLEVAREKVKRFAADDYWGRPVAGFGDPAAQLWIVGLAPAAHGANRTGRVFTGDRSGDFLFAALHRAGFASQPTSIHARDGLALTDTWVSASVRCAPPANKPEPREIAACREYLLREWALLRPRLRVVLALGRIGQDAFTDALHGAGEIGRRRLPFGHGLVHDLGGGRALIGSYHPSQQNTFTGRLTPASFDAVFATVRSKLAG